MGMVLKGFKILFLFLLVFRFGIQVNSHSVLDVENENYNPVKTECIQDQNLLTFSDVADVDEEEIKLTSILQTAYGFAPYLPLETFRIFSFRKPYQTTVYYQSDSSPPNWLNYDC